VFISAVLFVFWKFTSGKLSGNREHTMNAQMRHVLSSQDGMTDLARKRFLIVEDDPDIAQLISLHLGDLNADISVVSDGLEGLNRAISEDWSAILLDLQLPSMDGLELCRAIRTTEPAVPLMMVTSRSTELDRVLGLEIGADDYLVKPFSVAELKARVKALLRRSSQTNAPKPQSNSLQYLDLTLDSSSRKAELGGESLDLTAKEFDLLWFFASHPGMVFKRGELLDKVWGYGHEGYEHTVNSHINRLRSKLEKDSSKPIYIKTIWGVGYRFGE
jgi:DNA-binding response OmpR family regulator